MVVKRSHHLPPSGSLPPSRVPDTALRVQSGGTETRQDSKETFSGLLVRVSISKPGNCWVLTVRWLIPQSGFNLLCYTLLW